MRVLILCALVVGVVQGEVITGDHVRRNWQNRLANELPLYQPQDPLPVQPRRVLNIIWNSCGKPQDPIKLKSLDVPETINLEKNITVSADLAITSTLSSPIKVQMTAKRKVLWFWVHVPCIKDQFGSCTFDDICVIKPFGNSSACPPVFVENKIPCVCPFQPAEYQLKGVSIDLQQIDIPEELVSGKYYIKANIEDKAGTRLGCYETTFVLT